MSVEVKYWDTQEKLDKLCHENHLRFRFRADDYPIIFRFEPIWEKAAQMKFESDGFEGGEKRKPTDPEASIEMIFDDELIIQITNDFTIDDEILNKIKGMAKKLHYLYLHIWHKLKKQGEDWTTYTKEDPPPEN